MPLWSRSDGSVGPAGGVSLLGGLLLSPAALVARIWRWWSDKGLTWWRAWLRSRRVERRRAARAARVARRGIPEGGEGEVEATAGHDLGVVVDVEALAHGAGAGVPVVDIDELLPCTAGGEAAAVEDEQDRPLFEDDPYPWGCF